MFLSDLTGILQLPNLAEFRDTAPLSNNDGDGYGKVT